MFKAFKIITRYENGKEISQRLDIHDRVAPPAKVEIVLHDDENGICLRLKLETTSPRGFLMVSFANGLPAQLISNAKTYCNAVKMKNLSSSPGDTSILTHMNYFDSQTSDPFSIYFSTLEDCIKRHLKIQDGSQQDLQIQRIFDSLRHHLALCNKNEEVEYYTKHAEYYSQSTSSAEKCLTAANHAIKLISLNRNKTHLDYLQLSRIYSCLANAFNRNEKLSQTFIFAKNFFGGGEIDIITFKELNYLYHQSGLSSPEHIAMYVQILRSIDANHTHHALPHSAFKHELQNGDYIQFQTVLKQWEALSSLSSSKKPSRANSIFNTRQNTSKLEQLHAVDSKLESVIELNHGI